MVDVRVECVNRFVLLCNKPNATLTGTIENCL